MTIVGDIPLHPSQLTGEFVGAYVKNVMHLRELKLKEVSMKFHTDGTLPDANDPRTVWVFGSNLAGIHGAGAARVALEKFGAVDGQGVGYRGQSYAIPTMNRKLARLPRHVIAMHIAKFIVFAHHHSKHNFFVTRVGCGIAGYTDAEIAPMFKAAPANCSFAEAWREFLE